MRLCSCAPSNSAELSALIPVSMACSALSRLMAQSHWGEEEGAGFLPRPLGAEAALPLLLPVRNEKCKSKGDGSIWRWRGGEPDSQSSNGGALGPASPPSGPGAATHAASVARPLPLAQSLCFP